VENKKKNPTSKTFQKCFFFLKTLLTANPKRNISGNSDTTSGCESGGPSCEDSDEAEEAERPMNCADNNLEVNLSDSRTNSANSFERQDDDEDDEDEVETPKAVIGNLNFDQINFVRLPPPSPPPLKEHSYVKGFPAVKIQPHINTYEGELIKANPAAMI